MNVQIKSANAIHATAGHQPVRPCVREGVALARLDEVTS